jgi:hypothetical protein
VARAACSRTNASIAIKTPVPKPPRHSTTKEKKAASSIDGLLRIINDHAERAQIYQEREKHERENKESISYFRVAKSRCGKFETDNQGFVHRSTPIFDSSTQSNDEGHKRPLSSFDTSAKTTEQISTTNIEQHQMQGQQANNLLKNNDQYNENQSNKATDVVNTTSTWNTSSVPIQVC